MTQDKQAAFSMAVPLPGGCRAEVRWSCPGTAEARARLIQYLRLAQDIYANGQTEHVHELGNPDTVIELPALEAADQDR